MFQTTRPRSRRKRGLLACFLVLSMFIAQTGFASSPVTERVSLNQEGIPGNGASIDPSLSADGVLITFASESDNLVSGDTNGAQDILLHDWSTGATQRVSVASDGSQSNGASYTPSISGDGRFVAFASDASNLVPGDTNNVTDIFLHDRLTSQTVRVSRSSAGTQANGASDWPRISGDGSAIAYSSEATNLISGDTNNAADIYVFDRLSQTTSRVSVADTGAQANGGSLEPSISDNGRLVTFTSIASNLVPGDLAGYHDIFVRDRTAGDTFRVSISSGGEEGNSSSYRSAISGNGRFVAFRSHAWNLVASDGNWMADVFVHDLQTGATERVSVSSTGAQAVGGPSDEPAIREDGQLVVFRSHASNIVSGDDNGVPDIFLHDRSSGTTQRVSISTDGVQANGGSYWPAIDETGAVMAFYSEATNLISADGNNTWDVFARGEKPQPPPTATPTPTATATATATFTATPTSTMTPTNTPLPTATPTDTPTATPPPTNTATSTPTETPLPTATPTATYTSTPLPTATYTSTPLPTATYTATAPPSPTHTFTVEPSSTPTGTPTAAPTDPPPTDPPPTPGGDRCPLVLDFEFDASENRLGVGQIIDNEWEAWGIHITTRDPANHPAMIFDSSHPSGYDMDLGSPNGDFGGPGRGSGGKRGQPGENSQPLGNVLIISEDGNSNTPDDYYAGGTFIFEFDQPFNVDEIQLLDIDINESQGKIKAYNSEDDLIDTVGMKPLGNNSVQTLKLGFKNVRRLEIHLQSSGALAVLQLCEPDAPRAPQVNLTPIEELQEGQEFTLNGEIESADSSGWTGTVAWMKDAPASPIEIDADGTFTLTHVYGDDGVFNVKVTVEDSAGSQGQAMLPVTVLNAAPTVSVTNPLASFDCQGFFRGGMRKFGSYYCPEVERSIRRTHTDQSFEAIAEDPGSDDLTFRWSFGSNHTYYNNGLSEDPSNSPDGTYPFSATDSTTTSFSESGYKTLMLEVFDDDGGRTEVKFKIEVKKNLSCARGMGFWKHQFSGKGKGFFWDFELLGYLSTIDDLSRYFAHEHPVISIEETLHVLSKSDRTMLDSAEAHLISSWLNYASGAIQWDELIDTDGDGIGDTSFGGLVARLESKLLDTEYTHQELEWVKDAAESINAGDYGDDVCDDDFDDDFDDDVDDDFDDLGDDEIHENNDKDD